MRANIRSHRKAFTFREALVVPAVALIIAPVFIALTHRTHISTGDRHASISNAKQLSISMLTYATDYDDKFVIAGQWHSADPDAYRRYPESWYMPWSGIVEMYLKNHSVLVSPLTRATKPFMGPGANECKTSRQCELLYPTFGYNAVYLSPSSYSDPKHRMTALSTTSVAKPAQQVMLTEIWSRNNTRFGAFSRGLNTAYITLGTAEAPDGATDLGPDKPFGCLSWGNYDATVTEQLATDAEGRYQAGVAFRAAGDRTPVAFTDGHVKMFSAPALAQGTDWEGRHTARARNLRNGKYMWDPRGL